MCSIGVEMVHQNKSTRRTPAGVFVLVLRELLRSRTGRQYRSTSRWPMRNADAVRSSSSVESLSLYQWFARCLNALRTARLPLMQGRQA